jgi:hypothetical protein
MTWESCPTLYTGKNKLINVNVNTRFLNASLVALDLKCVASMYAVKKLPLLGIRLCLM